MIKQIVGITPETSDMDILASWHRDASTMRSPIVIIIEDAELCNPMVLAEFIVILSEWIAVLPLVLLIGMATSGEAIQKLLPGSAARHLHVHSFTFPLPDEYLEQIIMEVLLEPSSSFTLGCDALIYLLSQYQKYDNTVMFFIRALKLACMEHFLSQPLSFLCNKPSDDPIQTDMEGKLLEHVTMLPSAPSKQFSQGVVAGKGVAAASIKFREQKMKLSITIQCLLAASSLLGTGSLKIFREMLEYQSGKTNQDLIMIGLRQSESRNVTTILVKRLRDAPDAMVHKVLTKWIHLAESWKEMRTQMQDLLFKITSESSSGYGMEGASNGCGGSFREKQLLSSIEELPKQRQESLAGSGRTTSTGKDLLGESLVGENEVDNVNTSRTAGMTQQQKKQSPRLHGKMAANLLEHMMREHLKPLESLPLHEIFCYRDVAAIKQALVGEPRKLIQQNVEYPTMTLQCHCCPVNASDPSDSMNDSSILFRLAQKQGEEANLFELYQAFDDVLQRGTVKKQDISRKGHKSRKKIVHQEVDRTLVQARFCKGASELQHVGLLRMSSKKRSEYVRLAT